VARNQYINNKYNSKIGHRYKGDPAGHLGRNKRKSLGSALEFELDVNHPLNNTVSIQTLKPQPRKIPHQENTQLIPSKNLLKSLRYRSMSNGPL